MAYIEKAELKYYKDIQGGTDDTLIDLLIASAQKYIERKTHRVFEASSDTTRYLNAARQVEGRTLYLDKDLCSITTITNNADGTSEVIAAANYITKPRNETPYWAIKLKFNSGKYWRYTYDPEEGISIVGRWAYSTSPPDDIKQACRRLVAYLYKQRDSQVFDVSAMLGQGVLTIPKGIPVDVDVLLAPYIKVIV